MKKVIMFDKSRGDNLTVTPLYIGGLEGFEKLFEFVEGNYNAIVLRKIEGPDARKWILHCSGQEIFLIYDDFYGNYFEAPSKESEAIAYEIGRDLEKRLSETE